MENRTPRRIRLDLMTPSELAIYNATQEVEKIGADLKLTEAVIKLSEARNLVADFIDEKGVKIKSPFTDGQVERLNEFQNSGMHEFTCCSPDSIVECSRKSGLTNGTLKAINEGWVCPCGKYTQDWAHSFMTD